VYKSTKLLIMDQDVCKSRLRTIIIDQDVKIKEILQNNDIVVIIFSFFQSVGLTRHEAKTEGEPYVEHDEEADESANRDPVPVLVWILSAGHQCGHSQCGGGVCRIWLHSQTNTFSHHICQMHQHVAS
jgi:hypothetical protein